VQQLLQDALDDLCQRSPWLATLQAGLKEQTGEALSDRVDHLGLPRRRYAERLAEAGFAMDRAHTGETRALCPGAFAPVIYLRDDEQARCVLAVDSVSGFVERYPEADRGWRIEGPEGAPLRRCQVGAGSGVEVWVVERWGATGWHAQDSNLQQRETARDYLDAFRSRPRAEGSGTTGTLIRLFDDLCQLIVDAASDLGGDWATALFFRAERDHWVSQTPAAQVQGKRQDAWGLGWANQDHHTYRCSRSWFVEAMGILELLGLESREAFHAGAEAGWGAQVLQHPRLPIVTFVDVDLSPKELGVDFTHHVLPARDALGTVGLWCGLHGEAMFGAGLHHLACRYDFDAICSQLKARGIDVMPPFSDLPELRQAFTVASHRFVALDRLDRLQAAELITPEQADIFRGQGALGSHIELIERKQAYKGFHQRSINSIIAGTDPRRP
jgi:hypothetical protein